MQRLGLRRARQTLLGATIWSVAIAVALLGWSGSAGAQASDDLSSQIEVYETAAGNAHCDLNWTLLGAIAGFVSDHGRYAQPPGPGPIRWSERFELSGDDRWTATTAADVDPNPILGLPLDGEAGRRLVPDTDLGHLDGDTELDRAVGPFQFLPGTWSVYASDGNGDGEADPHDLADAAVAAAWLLCDVGAAEDEPAALTRYFGTAAWLADISEAQAAIADPPPAPASVGQRTAGTSDGVPLVWVEGIQVHEEIAENVANLLDAALADGVALRGWGWRSHERQIELRAAHCADIWITPASQCSPPTARPGHSLHETGRAIDFYVEHEGTQRAITRQSAEFAWLSANAERFGLFNLPSEPWHWSTTGG